MYVCKYVCLIAARQPFCCTEFLIDPWIDQFVYMWLLDCCIWANWPLWVYSCCEVWFGNCKCHYKGADMRICPTERSCGVYCRVHCMVIINNIYSSLERNTKTWPSESITEFKYTLFPKTAHYKARYTWITRYNGINEKPMCSSNVSLLYLLHGSPQLN